MRILITGGAGFIGSHIADAALRRGHEVATIDDLSTGRRDNVPADVRFTQADIRDGGAVTRVFTEFRPEVVCHQAAQTSVAASVKRPRHDAEINILGSLEVIEAAVRAGTERIVFASTGGAIYGEVPEGTRATEETPEQPLSPYACSKLAVERYLLACESSTGIQYNVLRYANVFGPRQDPHGEAGVVAIFAQRLLAGEPIQINGRERSGDDGCVRDYVYVDDVVRANLAAIEARVPDRFLNVCTGAETTTQGLAARLRALTQSTSPETHGAPRTGDLQRSVLDPGRGRWLGAATPLGAGLHRTLDWFRCRARTAA